MLPLIVIAAYAIKKIYDANHPSYSSGSSYTPPPIVVGDNICLLGRASSGKSSLGNALVGHDAFNTGTGHGTTTISQRVVFENDYNIIDTPGLLDTTNYEYQIRYEALRSKVLVYVTTGQLFQEELAFVGRLSREIKYNQHFLLFVNKQDIREYTVSSSQRLAEREAIIQQVSSWIPAENIGFGSAAPVYEQEVQAPEIEEIKSLIFKNL